MPEKTEAEHGLRTVEDRGGTAETPRRPARNRELPRARDAGRSRHYCTFGVTAHPVLLPPEHPLCSNNISSSDITAHRQISPRAIIVQPGVLVLSRRFGSSEFLCDIQGGPCADPFPLHKLRPRLMIVKETVTRQTMLVLLAHTTLIHWHPIIQPAHDVTIQLFASHLDLIKRQSFL